MTQRDASPAARRLGPKIPLAPADPGPAQGQLPGAAKPFEPEDPMEFVGVMLPGGDLEEQLEAVVQEYLMLGWNERQIMLLFRRPAFAGTHQILEVLGEEHVYAKVHGMFEEWSRGWLRGGANHG